MKCIQCQNPHYDGRCTCNKGIILKLGNGFYFSGSVEGGIIQWGMVEDPSKATFFNDPKSLSPDIFLKIISMFPGVKPVIFNGEVVENK